MFKGKGTVVGIRLTQRPVLLGRQLDHLIKLRTKGEEALSTRLEHAQEDCKRALGLYRAPAPALALHSAPASHFPFSPNLFLTA